MHNVHTPAQTQVFDLTSQDSFAHLSAWHDEFIIQAGEGRDFVLVGNKADKDQRCVSQKAALNWAQKQSNDEADRIPYFETSAKENLNVEQAFMAVAMKSLAKKRVAVCVEEKISATTRKTNKKHTHIHTPFFAVNRRTTTSSRVACRSTTRPSQRRRLAAKKIIGA